MQITVMLCFRFYLKKHSALVVVTAMKPVSDCVCINIFNVRSVRI